MKNEDLKYNQILKDCFWDSNFENSDIESILSGNDIRSKKFLFSKILLNSTNVLKDLKCFSKKELEEYIEDFKIPKFNKDFASRRKNIAEVYFLKKPLTITELQWTI